MGQNPDDCGDESMITYVYGKNVGMMMLKESERIIKVFLTQKLYDQKWQSLLEENDLSYEIRDRKSLDLLSKGGNHQGLVIAMIAYETYDIEDLVEEVPPGELGLLVMLDGIEDPHNLGAILRNCDGAGAHGIIIPKHHSVSLNATVAKVSSGAIATVKVAEVSNLVSTIKFLKKQGYWIAGLQAGEKTIYDYDFLSPLVIVIGHEGKGISRLVKENCDYMIGIPLAGTIKSLNASAVSAISMYQIQHQRSLSLQVGKKNDNLRKR